MRPDERAAPDHRLMTHQPVRASYGNVISARDRCAHADQLAGAQQIDRSNVNASDRKSRDVRRMRDTALFRYRAWISSRISASYFRLLPASSADFIAPGVWSGFRTSIARVSKSDLKRPEGKTNRRRKASGLDRRRLTDQQTFEISDGLSEALPEGRDLCGSEKLVSLAGIGASSFGIVDRQRPMHNAGG